MRRWAQRDRGHTGYGLVPVWRRSAATMPGMGCTSVLVEGQSDKAALLTLAAKYDADPGAISVTVMGGATNVGHYVVAAVAEKVRLAGLYDAEAEDHVAKALTAAGLVDGGGVTHLEQVGFFRCDPDLEAELIAALGADRVIDVLSSQGEDLRRFQKLQQMPEWRDRPVADQLRRWFGSGGSRKVRYAKLLVDAMSPEAAPRPLRLVLQYAVGDRTG